MTDQLNDEIPNSADDNDEYNHLDDNLPEPVTESPFPGGETDTTYDGCRTYRFVSPSAHYVMRALYNYELRNWTVIHYVKDSQPVVETIEDDRETYDPAAFIINAVG